MINTEVLIVEASTLFRNGNIQKAEAACRTILGANPLHVRASLLFALICSRTGRDAVALTYLRSLAKREPTDWEIQSALSGALFRAGQADEARAHGLLAIQLSPNKTEAYAVLGQNLDLIGAKEEAEEAFDNALKAGHHSPEFYRGLAQYLLRTGRNPQALTALESSIALDPNHVGPWLELGRLHFGYGDIPKAIQCAKEAVRCDETSADAHLLLGTVLSETEDTESATVHLRRALELRPNDAGVLTALGAVLQQQGRFEEAQPLLEQAVSLNPVNGMAQYLLVASRPMTPEDKPLLEDVEVLASQAAEQPIDRSYLWFAAGKGHEDLGEYERAMACYDSANSEAYDHWFAGNPWDRQFGHQALEQIRAEFGAERLGQLQAQGSQSEIPVLVMGLPRSGTTLVEQIISSHPQVGAAGELDFWHKNLSRTTNPTSGEIDPAHLASVGIDYLQELTAVNSEAKRITDKTLNNFSHLGYVCAAFPKARVIHVRRNPIDNCLSIYTTAFGRPPVFSLRREDIIFAYRAYAEIMKHWRRVLPPEQFIEVDYESVITDREPTTRRLIDSIGLPWDEACLYPERNDRKVLTASFWQVRQPIYKTSVNRWLRFEPWVPEFFELGEKVNSKFELM